MKQPFSMLNRLVHLLQKPYAILQKDGKSTPPVVFSETQEIFHRLGGKFWPGPLKMYLKTKSKDLFQPFRNNNNSKLTDDNDEKSYYVAISNPSHPLANRVLKEVSSLGRIMVALPSLQKQGSCNTKALDVCTHHSLQFLSEKHSIHVLNGEDKRELFSVPTCQCKPWKGSLWIDTASRTIYIRGKHDVDDFLSESNVIQAVRCNISTFFPTEENNNNDERRNNRRRVITAVLCKWKVIDERS